MLEGANQKILEAKIKRKQAYNWKQEAEEAPDLQSRQLGRH